MRKRKQNNPVDRLLIGHKVTDTWKYWVIYLLHNKDSLTSIFHFYAFKKPPAGVLEYLIKVLYTFYKDFVFQLRYIFQL